MIQPEDLIGKNVYGIGRAAAMCWIHFGRPVEIELRGRKRILCEFALDLDCPWRLRNSSGSIELGSADMFAPASGYDLDVDFDWEIQGSNLFDEKVKLLFPEDSQIVVTSAGWNGNYDLTITFSNGLCLESFVNASREECWRLFMPDLEHEDLIMTGTGIESC